MKQKTIAVLNLHTYLKIHCFRTVFLKCSKLEYNRVLFCGFLFDFFKDLFFYCSTTDKDLDPRKILMILT